MEIHCMMQRHFEYVWNNHKYGIIIINKCFLVFILTVSLICCGAAVCWGLCWTYCRHSPSPSALYKTIMYFNYPLKTHTHKHRKGNTENWHISFLVHTSLNKNICHHGMINDERAPHKSSRSTARCVFRACSSATFCYVWICILKSTGFGHNEVSTRQRLLHLRLHDC